MKKILSLFLAVVMLLGMVAMGVSAAEYADDRATVSLVLSDGIGLKFVFNGLTEGKWYTIEFEAESGNRRVKAQADAEGNASATFDALTPAMFDMVVTATLVEEDIYEQASVMQYCEYILQTAAFSDEVHAIAVDLLNYAAAVEAWQADNEGSPDDVDFLGRELTAEEEAALAAITTSTSGFKGTNWTGIAPVIYNTIGFTYTAPGTHSSVRNNCFTLNDDGSLTPKNRENVSAAYLQTYDMIVEGMWNGAKKDGKYTSTLDVNSFKIGDVLCVYSGSGYFACLYKGDGKFIVSNSNSQYYETDDVDADTVLTGLLLNTTWDFPATKSAEAFTKTDITLGGYWVLRASQVLPNYNVIDAGKVTELDVSFMGTVTNSILNPVTNDEQTDWTVQFGDSMPILGDSVGYRFYISSDIPVDTDFYGQLEGSDEIKTLKVKVNKDNTSLYYGMSYVDFTYLTPADLDKVVTVVAKNGDTNISIEKKFSAAGYTSAVLNGDYSGNLKSLVSAMMVYANGAKNYVESGYNDFYTYNTTVSNGVISTSGTVSIKDVTNFELIQYRMENIPAELLLGLKGHAKNILQSVYAAVGVKATGIIAATTNNTVDTESKVEGSDAYICRINLTVESDLFAELQAGDLIVTQLMNKKDHYDTNEWAIPEDGTADADKIYLGEYTNYVYLGNGRFARGTNGNPNVHVVDKEIFDNPATDGVMEDFLDFGAYSYVFIIRPSNLMQGN